MSDNCEHTPHQHAEAEVAHTHGDLSGGVQMADQANTEAETENEQEHGDEVVIKQEHENEPKGENSEPLADNELPLNPRLASDEQWKQRATLGLDSQDGTQDSAHRQNSTVTSTNSGDDCHLPSQLGLQVQQQACDTSNIYAEQHSPQSASERFDQGPARLSILPQMPSHIQYPNHTSGFGHAGGIPYTGFSNYAFGHQTSVPSMHMPSTFHTHSSMPTWAHQSSQLSQSSPFGWSDPFAMNQNVSLGSSSTRNLYNLSGVGEMREIEEISDDDEPLVTRAQRRPSASLSATNRASHPPTASASVEPLGGNDEDEFDMDQHNESCAHGSSPAPAPKDTTVQQSSSASLEPEAMSWKLPSYEALYLPPTTKDSFSMAKISIPGLVREELVLSPDHTTQEFTLFQHVFLPAHQALAIPDPMPAHAVLNFHTIAVLVVEAFTQYEIGDEISLGPFQRTPTAPDAAFTRQHSAKDADVDAIFFAVVDRWRAGLESNKQPLRMIRGAQEFCDVALDVIHFIKEHGLEGPAAPVRKQRKDKGVPRGPRKKAEGEDAVGGYGGVEEKGKGKRKVDETGEGVVTNTLQARKKVKVEKEEKTRAKPGPKPKVKQAPKPRAKKAKESGLIVIPRKK